MYIYFIFRYVCTYIPVYVRKVHTNTYLLSGLRLLFPEMTC